MKIKLHLLLIIIALSVWARSQENPNIEQGLKPYGSFQGGNIDSVDLTNGNLNIKVPLWSVPQRGALKFNYSIVYNHKNWYNKLLCSGQHCFPTWAFSYPIGVNIVSDTDIKTLCGPSSISIGLDCAVTTPDGYAHHTYGGNVVGGNGHALDASGFQTWVGSAIDPITGQLAYQGVTADRGGSRYEFQDISAKLRMEDPNLNNVVAFGASSGYSGTPPTIADTMGRAFLSPGFVGGTSTNDYSGCTGPGAIAAATIWDFPSADGTSSRFKFCYVDISPSTAFPAPIILQYPWDGKHVPVAVLQSIVLPNKTTWTFEYDLQYADLLKVTFPTGGTLSYTWGNAYFCNDFSTAALIKQGATPVSRVVMSRTLDANDGTGQHTWNYNWGTESDSPSARTRMVTVQDPDGNETQHTVAGINYSCSFYEIQTQYFQGPASNNQLLRTINTDYQLTSDLFATMFGARTDIFLSAVPIRVTTTWPSGKSSKIERDYDSTTITLSGFGGKTNTYHITNGNVVAEREYDYGASVPFRQTFTNYLYLQNFHYALNNLIDLVSSVQVVDGNGTQKSLTTYGYDELALQPSNEGLNHGSTSFWQATFNAAYRGNRTSTNVWLNTTGQTLTTTTQFFDTGNPYTKTDPNGNMTTYSYSAGYHSAYLTSTQDALGHQISAALDYNNGLVTSFFDQNNNQSNYSYDNMRRLVSATLPDAGQVTDCYTDAGGPTCQQSGPPYQVVTSKAITPSQTDVKTIVFDGLGRTIQAQVNSDPDGVTYIDTAYDAVGRVASESNPHWATPSSTDGVIQHQYDALGRETHLIQADRGVSSTDYSQFPMITVTDEAGKQRASQSDAFGDVITVWEPDVNGNLSLETDYQYNTLGNLTRVDQKGGDPTAANWRTRTFSYDSLSRLVCAANPEVQIATCLDPDNGSYAAGTIRYGYDNVGNLISKIAPTPNQASTATVTTNYSYDALNRITSKTFSDNSRSTTYIYDQNQLWGVPNLTNTVGRLVGTYTILPGYTTLDGSSGGGGIGSILSYDSMGRVIYENRFNQHVLPWADQIFNYAYNLDGSLQSIIYPSGHRLDYAYNNAQRPISAVDAADGISFATNAHYFATGALGFVMHGNITYTENYNVRMQPNEIRAAVGTQPALLDLSYNYYSCNVNGGNDGEICQVNNLADSSRSESFKYDALNRLIQASTPNAPLWGNTYTYDNWSNLLRKDLLAGYSDGEPALNISVNGNNHVTNWCYDAAGNVINPNFPCGGGSGSPGGGTMPAVPVNVFDSENRLIHSDIQGVITSYDYDADGRRVQKLDADGTGTLYWYETNGGVLEETDLMGNLNAEYVFFGGKRIARLDYPDPCLLTPPVHYYLSDHLGSASVVASAQGNAEEKSDFYPFGGERVITDLGIGNNYKFTGKERDPETGCDYFGARYYCNLTGRFLTPDLASASSSHVANPQKWNMYAYALNNPLRFIDPDGQAEFEIIVRRFISQKTAGILPPYAAGDHRKAFQPGTFRFEQRMTIETDSSKNGGNPVVSHSHQPGISIGISIGSNTVPFGPFGGPNLGIGLGIGSSDLSKVHEDAFRLAHGYDVRTVASFTADAKYPNTPAFLTPSISHDLIVTAIPNTDGTTSFYASGEYSTFPGLEISVRAVGSDKSTPIYGDNTDGSSDFLLGPTQLLCPDVLCEKTVPEDAPGATVQNSDSQSSGSQSSGPQN